MLIVPTEKRFDWRHTPVFLFAIVFLNILVFFLYQTGDNQKVYEALEGYSEYEFFEEEWPEFSAWLKSIDETDNIEEYNESYEIGNYDELAVQILLRNDFYLYLQAKPLRSDLNELYDDGRPQRRSVRREIQNKINSVSAFAFGLRPNDIHLSALLTHQFLHGDIMHLLGNLFFLVICGFAVEAALGHFRFLFFYLLGGIGAGLAHALTDLQSAAPLIGASGAISAVMAMYLGVFRFRKIEFFYWFFVFVGYFRAPALLLLPFYIGKEVYLFYTDPESSVAFMAHAGGFVVGAVLMLVSVLINPKILNEEYIEENQDIDPKREKLAKVYSAIERFQFKIAYETLAELIKEDGLNLEYAILRLNIFKLSRSKAYDRCLIDIFNLQHLQAHELKKVETLWQENPEVGEKMEDEALMGFAMRIANLPSPLSAKVIYTQLANKGYQHMDMKLLAEKIKTNMRRDITRGSRES